MEKSSQASRQPSSHAPTLLPAYLIVGSDALKRETVMKRLRERVATHGDLSFNSNTFEGEDASGTDIVVALNTMPFASDLRLVHVRKTDRLKKDDAEAIVAYCASPNESAVLALEAEKLAKNTRLYKAIAALGATAIIDCAPLKRADLPRAVRSMATGYGVVLSEGAARSLIELVGEDTIRLDNEIKKIALAHRGTDPVTQHEVTSMVARTAGVKPWEFVDAFSARDVQKCMQYWMAMDSVSPYVLISLCTTRIRELICARAFILRGNPQGIARALGLPDWRCKNHVHWAKLYTAAELRSALASSRDAEAAMKSGANPQETMLLWALGVMDKTQTHTAVRV